MNRKARATIEQYGMLWQGDAVTAAVSGGADSVALLDFLCSLAELNLTVRACHLNHCLRGAESDRDEQLVRTMCREYGIPLDVKRVEVAPLARARGHSLEQAARDERYAFFASLSARDGCKIATAHTLSDSAETVLFNIARGTGIAGVCGIPPVRGNIIRPLVACTRAEIEAYCADHGLCYVTDSTNFSDAYTRNFIRHSILPQLVRVNPDVQGAIGRMAETLRQDAEYLAEEASRAKRGLLRGEGLDAAGLRQLHPALRSRVIAELLAERGAERSADRIGIITGMLQTGSPRVLQVGKGDYVSLRGGLLRLEHREQPGGGPIETVAAHKSELDGARFTLGCGKSISFSVVNCADYEIFKNNTDLVLKNAVDYDRISVDIFIRSRQPGDRIRQAGRGCSKSLKKLYSELALADRGRLCVLADSGGVVFAEGAGADERVCVDASTKNMLTFEITQRETEDHRL